MVDKILNTLCTTTTAAAAAIRRDKRRASLFPRHFIMIPRVRRRLIYAQPLGTHGRRCELRGGGVVRSGRNRWTTGGQRALVIYRFDFNHTPRPPRRSNRSPRRASRALAMESGRPIRGVSFAWLRIAVGFPEPCRRDSDTRGECEEIFSNPSLTGAYLGIFYGAGEWSKFFYLFSDNNHWLIDNHRQIITVNNCTDNIVVHTLLL